MRQRATAREEALHLIRLVWTHPQNEHRRVSALLRLVAWQVWQRTIGRPWTVHLTPDRIIRCYPHSAGASNVIYCRLIEWRDMPFVLHYLRPGDVFIDIGANVGVYSLLASIVEGVRIFAFEPSGRAFRRLVENIEINGLTQISANRIALAEADGTGFLTEDRDTTNRLIEDPQGLNVEPVVVRSLDSFLDDHPLQQPPTLLKVDVEGAEDAVIRGAWRTICSHKPVLIIEWNNPVQVRELLSEIGYGFYRYEPDARALSQIEDDAENQNAIAIHSIGAASSRVAGQPWV